MLAEDYVKLGLRLNKHIPGLVDAYFGPRTLRDTITAEDTIPLPALRQQAVELTERLASEINETARREFLSKQLDALIAQIDYSAGQIADFREYVARLFDITVTSVDEDRLEGYRQEIIQLLHGLGYTGEPRQMLIRWETDGLVSGDLLLDLVQTKVLEHRDKTLRLLDLPQGEHVAIEGVKGQPWSAYNWYKGNYFSIIQINLDIPRHKLEVAELAAHETYPGHHTEHTLKEKLIFHERGYVEASIALINTPASVISEGIASAAALFIDTEVPDTNMLIARALRKLRRGCDVNATLMLHETGLNDEACISYLETEGLMTRARAQKRHEFLTHQLWAPYSFTYWAGGELVEQFYVRAKSTGKATAALRTLYSEQLTPSALRQMLAEL